MWLFMDGSVSTAAVLQKIEDNAISHEARLTCIHEPCEVDWQLGSSGRKAITLNC